MSLFGFYFLMFVVALILNSIIHALVDLISDINPNHRLRSLTLGAVFWWLTIPLNIVHLACSLLVFCNDVISYFGKFRGLKPADMAKRYNLALLKLKELETIDRSSIEDFPMDRPEIFKAEIVNDRYSWRLIRFIGRVEQNVDKSISDCLRMKLEDGIKTIKEEDEKKSKEELEEKFKNLSA